MKILRLSFLFAFAFICAGVNAAQPQEKETSASILSKIPPPVMAVIDLQKILEEAKAAKAVQKQLEAQRAKFQSEISGEEDELRQAEKELASIRNSVTPDIYAEKEQQLRQRFLIVERRVQNRRKALEQAYNDSMEEIQKTLREIVSIIAKDRGANIVLVKQQAFWSDKQMDITEEVLGQLNKVLPEVKVNISPEIKGRKAEEQGEKTMMLKKQAR